MQENKFTRLTLEQSDKKITWEVPYEDATGEDLVQAFYSLMIGMTFLPTTIRQSMKEFVEDDFNFNSKHDE
jgi:hypothetical protein